MRVTEMHIKFPQDIIDKLDRGTLVDDNGDFLDRGLIGFCSAVLDNEMVVTNIKIISGRDGPFISMPSRRPTYHMPCGHKCAYEDKFCSYCGKRLDWRKFGDVEKRFIDVVHPITPEFRDYLATEIVTRVREVIENGEWEQAHRPN